MIITYDRPCVPKIVTFLSSSHIKSINKSSELYRVFYKYTVKLSYNDHGYNKHNLLIFLVPNSHFTT